MVHLFTKIINFIKIIIKLYRAIRQLAFIFLKRKKHIISFKILLIMEITSILKFISFKHTTGL